jgi:hypothetical protein
MLLSLLQIRFVAATKNIFENTLVHLLFLKALTLFGYYRRVATNLCMYSLYRDSAVWKVHSNVRSSYAHHSASIPRRSPCFPHQIPFASSIALVNTSLVCTIQVFKFHFLDHRTLASRHSFFIHSILLAILPVTSSTPMHRPARPRLPRAQSKNSKLQESSTRSHPRRDRTCVPRVCLSPASTALVLCYTTFVLTRVRASPLDCVPVSPPASCLVLPAFPSCFLPLFLFLLDRSLSWCCILDYRPEAFGRQYSLLCSVYKTRNSLPRMSASPSRPLDAYGVNLCFSHLFAIKL